MRARGPTPCAPGCPRPPAAAGQPGRRGEGVSCAPRGAAVCASALRFPPPRLRLSGGAGPGGRRACPLRPCTGSRAAGETGVAGAGAGARAHAPESPPPGGGKPPLRGIGALFIAWGPEARVLGESSVALRPSTLQEASPCSEWA